MTDYISKAQVLDIYAELYDIFEDNRAIRKELDEIYGKINGLVNIEAEPVKHGRWIPVDSYSAFGGSEEVWRAHGNPTAYHYCSECKEQSRRDEFGDEILSEYCPDCGAKLEGGGADYNEAAEREPGYEEAVEMAQYCERYEPTYNPEDGSM